MNRLRLTLGRHRHVAAAILALALVLRVLVPAGYMPAFDHGTVGVRICGSQIAQPMPGGMHHGAGHEDSQNHADQPCAFAGLAAPADPPAAFAAFLPVPAASQVAFFGAEPGPLVLSTGRSHPPARGPPVLA